MRVHMLLLCAVLCVACAAGDSHEALLLEAQNRWLVNMQRKADAAQLAAVEAVLAADGGEFEALRFGDNTLVTYIAEGLAEEVVAVLRSMAGVEEVANDGLVQVQEECTARSSTATTTYAQRAITGGTGFRYKKSWGKGVNVYVLDTGVRCSHSEFEDRCETGKSFSSGDPQDGEGHGTHIAGTVAGKTYGVAPAAHVIGVKVMSDEGKGFFSAVEKGLAWVETHAKGTGKPSVINLSIGHFSKRLSGIVDTLSSKITVVVSAGNDNVDSCTYHPAAAKGAITVAASTQLNKLRKSSNWGKCVDIVAPGEHIKSAKVPTSKALLALLPAIHPFHGKSNKFTLKSGTSMAAPHVAGAAAVKLSQSPQATPAEVRKWLLDNAAEDVLSGPLNDTPNLLLQVPCDAGEGDDSAQQPKQKGTNTPLPSTPLPDTPLPSTPLTDIPLPRNASSGSCEDLTVNGEPWRNIYRNGCSWYKNELYCVNYGHRFRNTYTADEACCACGGGRN